MLDPPHGLQLLLSRLCSQISDPLYCLHPILLATSAVVFAGARLAALLAVASLAAPHGVLAYARPDALLAVSCYADADAGSAALLAPDSSPVVR